MSEDHATDRLHRVLAEVWRERRPALLERLTSLDRAASAASAGTLDETVRAAAERDAHKLAGSLGTFGHVEGSRLAANAERTLQAVAGARTLTGDELPTILRELRHLLEEDGAAGSTEGPELLVVHPAPAQLDDLRITAETHGLGWRAVADVAAARNAVTTRPPAVVLLDQRLPGATSLIGELGRHEPAIPTLMASTPRDLVDRVAAVEAGAYGFLDRSAGAQHLLEVVDDLLGRARPMAGCVVLALPHDPARDEVQAALGGLGLEVRGVDTVHGLRELIEDATPDLVLVGDLPGTSSLSLTRALRGDDRLVPVPVVVVATDPDTTFLRGAADAGADAVLTRPLDLPSLRARTSRVLRRAQAIRASAETDRLTGLATRRRLDTELTRYVALADRLHQPLTLTLVDLDRFKRINDRYGHPTGDDVLRGVASLLRDAFRGEDVVARWGGEELAIATFGMTTPDSVTRTEAVLGRLREQGFEAPDGSRFRVTFSAGIAEYDVDATDAVELVAAADRALYRAKATGRDRVVAAGWQPLAVPDTVDVVIVDDDAVLTELLGRAFDDQHLSHVTIENGGRAIERLTGGERERARVVLLDVDIPGADGHAVLDALAGACVLEETRAIMLTAEADDAHVVEALARGAFDHVTKPFSVPVLVQRVLRALTG